MHPASKRQSLAARLLLCTGLGLAAPLASADDAALELLAAMSHAGDSLEYSGEFVYVADGRISSMKIMHMPATGEQGSRQKLMALDGSMREIIQQDDVVACVLPDQKMGVREKRQARQLFKLNLGPRLEQISVHYDLNVQGPDRVANRDCTRMKIVPKDSYRYGYNLCIDLDTRLLLSSELLTPDDTVLESYRFVSIHFERIDSADISSSTPETALEWIDDSEASDKNHPEQPTAPGKWQVSSNASGFEQTHYIERVSPVLGAKIRHLVLSDGLAQVSIFVIPRSLSAAETGKLMNMGSISSYSRLADEHMITAVGEVPGTTVQLLVEHTGRHSN